MQYHGSHEVSEHSAGIFNQISVGSWRLERLDRSIAGAMSLPSDSAEFGSSRDIYIFLSPSKTNQGLLT